MKKFYVRNVVLLLFALYINLSFGQSDIYQSSVLLNSHGTGNQLYDLQATNGNPNFDAFDLGTFGTGDSLLLNGAEHHIVNCGSDTILYSWLEYRMYLVSGTAPLFSTIEIPLYGNTTGADPGCQNQRWLETDTPIDVLNGLPSGDYYLEVLTRSEGDSTGDSTSDFTVYADNGGTNYKATFRVDDSPVANCLANLTVQLDASGNATITAADIDNESNDDFGNVSLAIDTDTFNCSDVGSPVTVTLTVTDSIGQMSTCTTNVTVEDSVAPIAPTLTDITVDCGGTLTIPTTTDACGGTITGTTSDTLSFVEGGSTNITWTFDDGNGNSTAAVQVYNYDDTTDPVTPTLNEVTDQCSVTLTAPTTSDDCAGTITGTTSTEFPITAQGTTVVTWTFDDGNGNSITQTQNVIITDNTAPTPNLGALPNVTAQCSVTSLTPPAATDNCGGTVTVTHNATLPITAQGTTVVVWTYEDVNGNTSTQNQNVIITDNTAPIPNLTSLPEVSAQCSVTSLTPPSATDNCGGTVTVTHNATLPITAQGTTVVVWTYQDVNGNTSTQNQNVIITDNTPPTPNLTSLPNLTAQCSVTSLTDPAATDNCGGTVTVTHNASLPITAQGTTMVVWTYQDVNGNITTQNQNVIITDNTAPTPTLANLADVTSQCSVTSLTPPTASDNCGGTVTVTHNASLPITAQGTTVVVWTYQDVNGNTSTQNQNIIVTDNTAPTPTLANLAEVTAQCSVTSLTPPTATDNCGGAVTVTHNATLPITAQGTTVVVWSYQDVNGNSSIQNQNVIITDNTPPAPNLASLPNVTAQCSVTSLTPPTATDNCGGTVTITHNASLPITAQGTTIVVWTYQDVNGNSSTQNQNIIVTDNTAPTPTLANLAEVTAQCSVTSLTPPTATDNCGGTVTITHNASLPITAQGTTIVVWTYQDVNGNTSTQNQNVIVDDTIAPVPNVMTLPDLTGQCSVTVSTAPSASDACEGSITGTTTDPLTYTAQGTYIITWTYDDGNGNITNQTQTVLVEDTVAPVPTVANLPDLTGQCSVTVSTVPTASDPCEGSIPGTTIDPLAYTTQGTYTITWIYDDGNGNTSTQNQIVIVEDTIAPVPNVANLTNATGQCSATVTAPTANDNCSGTITATTTSPLTYNVQGTYTIVWTYDDSNGNTSTQNQTVIVDDTIAPVPNVATLPNATGQCSVTVTAPTANDNCSGTLTATTTSPLTYNSQGTYTIVWTYNDGNGNTSTQNQTVIVEDTITPTIICQNISITLDATGNASIIPANIDNGSTDNCGITSRSLDNTSFDCGDLGTNSVTLSVYDAAGNASTCTAIVTVLDPAANSSVSIVSDDANNQICLGDTISFTATPVNAGTTQFYEWFINDVSEGVTTVPTFTPVTAPTETISVFVRMTTDLSACDPQLSNTVTIIVSPLPAVNVSSTSICIDNTSQSAIPATGGTWTSSNTGVATISNSGAITPVSPGSVSFTYTNSTTGCINTTLAVTINPLPIVTAPESICVNATATLLTSTSGTWISNNPTRASITNAGIVTGLSAGNATFTFINANGCSATTNSVEILEIPVITSVTSSPTTVCSGDASVLTVNVQGAGGVTETIVNYNFNSGNDYDELMDISTTPNITSTFSSPNNTNNIPFNTANGTGGGAFTNNANGPSLMQVDDWADGNDYDGFVDSGLWSLNINGTALANYENLRFSFQYRRDTRFGQNKSIRVEYRVGTAGAWTTTVVQVPSGDAYYTNNWPSANISLPASFNNSSVIQFRMRVDDGSTFNECSWWDHYFGNCADTVNGVKNKREPHIYIDNLQLQGSSTGAGFDYAWSANTGVDAGLPISATTPSAGNSQITVHPEVTTQYTVTVINSDGCPATEVVTVNVFPTPEILIHADYCPEDLPSTSPQNESNMVKLVASADQSITNWVWNTGETGNTIYVDIAGEYQVVGTTVNGCSQSATLDVAQELVVNGNFSQGNTGFDSDYTYRADGPGNTELVNDEIGPGNPPSYVNGYSITTNGQNVHNNFHGTDHTDNLGNFMAVNGHGTQYVIWSQTVNVEEGIDYYFAAWARSLNNVGPYGKLRFRVNGLQVGSQLDLGAYPANGWDRFYGIWTATVTGPILIEIVNNENSFGGNDFGIDDISFATLSTFIYLTSYVGSDSQIICENNPIDDITYEVGGGLSGPIIEGLPSGLDTSFDGLELRITGTPTQTGLFTYTVNTNASCGSKTATGTITVNEAAIVTINTPDQAVCQSTGSLALSATISGSGTSGTWSTSGTGTFVPTNTDPNATYTFGATETGITTLTFTSNDPDGSGATGPCDVAVATIDIDIIPYRIATVGPNQTTANCADTTVTLAANDVAGEWSAVPDTGYFSNASVHNSSFTGDSGQVYTLTWTAANTSPCASTSATMTVTIPDCGNNLMFDGVDDHISFGDHYPMTSGAFSIEAWIKAANVSGTKTIISKRNASALTTGYDLSLVDNILRFRYNGTQITATQTINSTKWYHVAVTFDGSVYTMYIDGFLIRSSNPGALAPTENTNKALIGAMDRTNNSPTHYFNGAIDEVRIWNTALSQSQIRQMMNQEIKDNDNNVMGEVVPMHITGTLQWKNLIGYYQMNTGPQTLLAGGTVPDIASDPIALPGILIAMTDNQTENAPIPYVSITDAAWDDSATWSVGDVQQIPNSRVNNVVPNQLQTWNIVRTATNVTTNRVPSNPEAGTTRVLGLLVDTDRLSISNDQPLYVNKYLKIDGTLDLVGESQLLQPTGSIVDFNGIGKLERDQQGTPNLYNYNYWGSPVGTDGTSSDRTYTLGNILYDGPAVQWTNDYNAPGTTNPVTLSTRWLYTYSNLTGAYAEWHSISPATAVSAGLGFTMKGSGVSTEDQNYTFAGQPNNGTISMPISANNQTLLGNPYPSAIDANLFIDDNESALLDGALIFWEQKPNSATHTLAQYEGRYSYYVKTGSIPATTPPEILGDGSVLKLPGRFVPVSQGFFVMAKNANGSITFNNDQRIFMKEGDNSIFLRQYENSQPSESEFEDDIQRIRLGVKTPEGAVRHLLLGFTPDDAATDAVDYGYDALNSDSFPSDGAFMINGHRYVIQGVGSFDDTSQYPFALTLDIDGSIEFSLTDFENFDTDPNVYIYDSVLGTYHPIHDTGFAITLDAGSYNNRFFLTFSEDETLSTIDTDFKDIIVNYLQTTDEIYIKVPNSISVKQVYLINMAGQVVKGWNSTNMSISNEMKIPVKDLSEGHYIIKIHTDTNTFNKKIIVKY